MNFPFSEQFHDSWSHSLQFLLFKPAEIINSLPSRLIHWAVTTLESGIFLYIFEEPFLDWHTSYFFLGYTKCILVSFCISYLCISFLIREIKLQFLALGMLNWYNKNKLSSFKFEARFVEFCLFIEISVLYNHPLFIQEDECRSRTLLRTI